MSGVPGVSLSILCPKSMILWARGLEEYYARAKHFGIAEEKAKSILKEELDRASTSVVGNSYQALDTANKRLIL